ncbi:hypothetical protein ACFQFH_01250 [Halobaculum halobium]|uniref:Uncharacterized protein n=1 Tax=Halobaculum halobium TaxID=3032281 RepID=A0ABD5T7J3_9EURY|nr:hypothetical protein [Halobaculum sp. SYNS20]
MVASADDAGSSLSLICPLNPNIGYNKIRADCGDIIPEVMHRRQ